MDKTGAEFKTDELLHHSYSELSLVMTTSEITHQTHTPAKGPTSPVEACIETGLETYSQYTKYKHVFLQ